MFNIHFVYEVHIVSRLSSRMQIQYTDEFFYLTMSCCHATVCHIFHLFCEYVSPAIRLDLTTSRPPPPPPFVTLSPSHREI
jgi:hypothetical protein